MLRLYIYLLFIIRFKLINVTMFLRTPNKQFLCLDKQTDTQYKVKHQCRNKLDAIKPHTSTTE